MRVLGVLLACLGLVRGPRPGATSGTLLLFALGAALACSWLLPSLDPPGLAVLTALLTGAAAFAAFPPRPAAAGAVAGLLLLAIHGLWSALAVAFGAVLAWSVPAEQWIAIALAAVGFAVTALRRTAVRVPLALPLGLLIAAAVAGWMREDGMVRCDDYLRVRATGATLTVPSSPELAHCAPGEILLVDRYPRQFWQHPDGDLLFVTSQRGDHDYSLGRAAGRRVPAWLSGAICAVRGDAPPVCMGEGKADGIADAPGLGRLYVTSHDGDRTLLSILPRDGTLTPLAQVELPMKAALFYLDETRDVLGLSEDEGRHVYLRRVADLSPLRTVPGPFINEHIRYDARRNEGVICASGGSAFAGGRFPAAAFTGLPFAYRPLAPSTRHPTSLLAATWGCDWDPVSRRVYVAVASLGVLQELDYDSGALRRAIPIGPGARPVVFDAARRLVYVAFFLEGTVLAIDPASGATVARWPAGRFVRSLALARDGQALLAASNLGLVRIPLPEERGSGAGGRGPGGG